MPRDAEPTSGSASRLSGCLRAPRESTSLRAPRLDGPSGQEPKRRLAAERGLDPPDRVEVPVAGAVAQASARQVEAVVEERRELQAARDVAVVAHVVLDRSEHR